MQSVKQDSPPGAPAIVIVSQPSWALRTLAPRPVPFGRFTIIATVACCVCGLIFGISLGLAQGDIWIHVKAALALTTGGLAVGLAFIYLLGRLVPRSVYSASVWKAIFASYLIYAVGGATAATFALSLRLMLPPIVGAMRLWENLTAIVLAAFVSVLLGLLANRSSDRDERIAQQMRELRREIVGRKKAERQLEGLYEEEKELRHKLEAEMEKRVDFTRALVHELKTPLTSILASNELLLEELEDEALLRLGRNVSQAASDLSRRVDELLDLAKGEVGILELDCTQLDALQLLQGVAAEMTPAAARRGQQLEVWLPSSLSPVWADEDRLRHVLFNLFNNALKWTPDGGRITLSAAEQDGFLHVEVQDTGPGVGEEDIETLFEPYRHGKGDGPRPLGLGIGLSLCKTLVELHGGKIWAASHAGKGSTFGFSLPLAPEPGGTQPEG